MQQHVHTSFLRNFGFLSTRTKFLGECCLATGQDRVCFFAGKLYVAESFPCDLVDGEKLWHLEAVEPYQVVVNVQPSEDKSRKYKQ